MDDAPTYQDRLFAGIDELIQQYARAACAAERLGEDDGGADRTRDGELTAAVLIKHYVEHRLAETGPYVPDGGAVAIIVND
jgi:hypothetical protein